MNKDIKLIEDKLKDIIVKNEDAIKGFEKGAENAKEIGTKSYFESKADERRNFLSNLRTAAPELNLGDWKIEGSTAGAAHRTWMDVKAFFSSDNDESMLEEAVRGDKATIDDYNDAISETLVPRSVKILLTEQRDIIQNDLETSEILQKFR